MVKAAKSATRKAICYHQTAIKKLLGAETYLYRTRTPGERMHAEEIIFALLILLRHTHNKHEGVCQ